MATTALTSRLLEMQVNENIFKVEIGQLSTRVTNLSDSLKNVAFCILGIFTLFIPQIIFAFQYCNAKSNLQRLNDKVKEVTANIAQLKDELKRAQSAVKALENQNKSDTAQPQPQLTPPQPSLNPQKTVILSPSSTQEKNDKNLKEEETRVMADAETKAAVRPAAEIKATINTKAAQEAKALTNLKATAEAEATLRIVSDAKATTNIKATPEAKAPENLTATSDAEDAVRPATNVANEAEENKDGKIQNFVDMIREGAKTARVVAANAASAIGGAGKVVVQFIKARPEVGLAVFAVVVQIGTAVSDLQEDSQ